MIKYLLILGFFSLNQLESQDNNLRNLVSNLSWESFDFHITTYYTELVFKDDYSKEILHIGKPATNELLNVIEDEEKGVIAHLLLTKIYYPKKLKVQTAYIYNKEDIQEIVYTVNTLKWHSYEKEDNLVQKTDLRNAKEYWLKRINKKFIEN